MAELTASECGHATRCAGRWNQHGGDAVNVARVTTNVVGNWNVQWRQTRNAHGRYAIKRTRNDIDAVAIGAISGDAAVTE